MTFEITINGWAPSWLNTMLPNGQPDIRPISQVVRDLMAKHPPIEPFTLSIDRPRDNAQEDA